MVLPIELLEIQIFLALLCTGYSWFVHDSNNYTDVIAGVVAVIFWWTSGLSILTGIQSETVTYSGSWLMWIFLGIGAIVALITFTKIVDVINSRKDHVNMGFDHRL
jgi:hypothetical protein